MTDIFICISAISGGGAERIAVELSNNLPSYISRKMITLYDTDNKYQVVSELHSLSPSYKSKILKIVMQPICILKYMHLIQINRPKVSISFLPLDNLINIISSVMMHIQPIISVHGMPSNNYGVIYKIIKYIVFLLAKYTNTNIIAVSNGVKNELVQLYNIPVAKITVIYNPIDIDTISNLALKPVDEYLFETKIPIIITVGRLNKVKGQWHLLRVFAELQKTYPCQLVLCGEGPEKEYLQILARELNILDHVLFLGWCDNPYKYMANSTLFVQSSLSEALPNVLVEALCCGCPVVAANCSSGIVEIIGSDEKYGLLSEKMSGNQYSINEPLDLSEQHLLIQMKRVLSDSQLRGTLHKNGMERAKYFSTEVRIKEYEELISSY